MKLYWHIWQLLTIPGLRLGLLTALAILTLWQAAADSSGVWQQYRQQQAELATFAQWPEVKSDLQGKINHSAARKCQRRGRNIRSFRCQQLFR
jgi:hypothetical protein